MYGYEKGQPMAEDQATMPPEGAPPPPEAAPPEAVDDSEAQLQELAQSAPAPTKPFSIKALKTLLDTFNKTLSKISAVDMPKIEIDLEGAEKGKMDQPLPADLFLPLVAVSELIKMVGGGEFESKLGFDPFTIVTDTDLRKVTALLKMMAKDKKFIEAVKELQEGGPEASSMEEDEGDDMAPPPDDMGAQDETLASAMQ
tara:strand:- start:225 stop:821 length:597 start_codon:yes stop_codon:yes gene_type:complete